MVHKQAWSINNYSTLETYQEGNPDQGRHPSHPDLYHVLLSNPSGNLLSIAKLMADFWWGFKDGKRKMHWRSWEWLSTPKSLGGMVFRDLALFNEAMLGKYAWKLLTELTPYVPVFLMDVISWSVIFGMRLGRVLLLLRGEVYWRARKWFNKTFDGLLEMGVTPRS
jgi:hypothetical protein